MEKRFDNVEFIESYLTSNKEDRSRLFSEFEEELERNEELRKKVMAQEIIIRGLEDLYVKELSQQYKEWDDEANSPPIDRSLLLTSKWALPLAASLLLFIGGITTNHFLGRRYSNASLIAKHRPEVYVVQGDRSIIRGFEEANTLTGYIVKTECEQIRAYQDTMDTRLELRHFLQFELGACFFRKGEYQIANNYLNSFVSRIDSKNESWNSANWMLILSRIGNKEPDEEILRDLKDLSNSTSDVFQENALNLSKDLNSLGRKFYRFIPSFSKK